ncbi:MAG: nucleotidyl transferase [Acidimicrobiales bacterium]|nr:nucleotidyl transferase [Acidimicrobiales bacterium]
MRPKALCPVGNIPLVDIAVARAGTVTDRIAVNVHHGRMPMESHLAGRVHLSIEADRALGTAGGVAHLRPWIDGRPVLVTNADIWLGADVDLSQFVEDWDRERVRLLVAPGGRRPDFGHRRYAGVALMPWRAVDALPDEPAGLYEVSWRDAEATGRLELVDHVGPFFDCGTAADYLAANMAASGGASVIGRGAVVDGEIHESVVWPGGEVAAYERLVRAIRTDDRVTVLVR